VTGVASGTTSAEKEPRTLDFNLGTLGTILEILLNFSYSTLIHMVTFSYHTVYNQTLISILTTDKTNKTDSATINMVLRYG